MAVHSAPKFASNEGVLDALCENLSVWLDGAREEHGEIILTAKRDQIETVLRTLRDDHQYQQLMEIAGADYPERAERFEARCHPIPRLRIDRLNHAAERRDLSRFQPAFRRPGLRQPAEGV